MAAARVDSHAERRKVLFPALAAALLDPTYESRNKAGLLVRAALGRSAFDFLKRFVPKTSGSSGTVPDCGASALQL